MEHAIQPLAKDIGEKAHNPLIKQRQDGSALNVADATLPSYMNVPIVIG